MQVIVFSGRRLLPRGTRPTSRPAWTRATRNGHPDVCAVMAKLIDLSGVHQGVSRSEPATGQSVSGRRFHDKRAIKKSATTAAEKTFSVAKQRRIGGIYWGSSRDIVCGCA